MKGEYTVGQYLVDRLYELGLEHLFSIAGDYSIDWINRYIEPSKIALVQEVNELNAGYAADGYARVQGIGALCVTYSAGALCAVNAIAGAFVEKVPVVLINGTPSVAKTLTFQQTGFSAHHFISGRATDRQVFEYITVATARLEHPDLAPMAIDYALTQCITQQRPVYLELLQDVVDLECEPPKERLKAGRLVSDEENLKAAVAEISGKLQTAANPVIWVGVEVDRFGLQEKISALVQKLKLPFVTELLSKAVLSEQNELFVGVFDGQASSTAVKSLVEEADFVLALGVWLTDLNSLGWSPDFNKTAFVSFDTVKYGTSLHVQVALEHLLDGLLAEELTDKAVIPLEQASDEPWVLDGGAEITYDGLYSFVARYVDEKTIVGTDASLNYFGSLLLQVPAAGAFIAQPSYSSIGYIAPAMTGVCLAKGSDHRALVFAGDGGFQMSAQCLSTQTRFGLNPIIFVIDNGVYGVEQWLADSTVFSTDQPFFDSCLLHQWNYSKLADVFGCQGWKVATYGELGDAMTGAMANASSPSIIQVVVPHKSIPENATWKAH